MKRIYEEFVIIFLQNEKSVIYLRYLRKNMHMEDKSHGFIAA